MSIKLDAIYQLGHIITSLSEFSGDTLTPRDKATAGIRLSNAISLLCQLGLDPASLPHQVKPLPGPMWWQMAKVIIAYRLGAKPHELPGDLLTKYSRLAQDLIAQPAQPMYSAPKDRPIIVWATGDDLPPMYAICCYHEEAGFCVDELRQPVLWWEIPQ